MKWVPAHINRYKYLLFQQSGVIAIEFALLVPVFFLLVFAIISFGYVFVIYEAEGRAVSSVASTIQVYPTNEAWTKTFALESGGNLFSFASSGNYICAKAIPNGGQVGGSYCNPGTWTTTAADAGVAAGTAYQVAIQAGVTPNLPLPSAFKWLIGKQLIQQAVVTVGGPQATIPVCNGAGQALQSDGASYSCVQLVPSCFGTGYKIVTDPNGNLVCQKIATVFTVTVNDINNGGGPCQALTNDASNVTIYQNLQWATTCASLYCQGIGYKTGIAQPPLMKDQKGGTCGWIFQSGSDYTADASCPVTVYCW